MVCQRYYSKSYDPNLTSFGGKSPSLWRDREEWDQLYIVIDAVLIEFILNLHQINDFHVTRWYS